MLGQLDDVKRLVEGLRSGEAQSLKVVVTPAIAQQLLPQALGQWRRRHARVNCELATQHTREIIDALLLHEVRYRLHLECADASGTDDSRTGPHAPEGIGASRVLGTGVSAGTPMTVAELAGQRLIALGAHDPLARRLDGLLASEMRRSPSEDQR